MTIFPTLSQEQRQQLASMSRAELLHSAAEHEGEARWQQLQAHALRELAAGGRNETPIATSASDRRPRRTTRRKPPALEAVAGHSPRLPDDLTRGDLPKFAMQRGEDPTGQKGLILGVMWLTRDSTWSSREIKDELERIGLLTLKPRMGTNYLSRMAAADRPWVVKQGQGRDTRYKISPDVRPIERSGAATSPAAGGGDRT